MLQRSDEWFQARLGKVTASRIDSLMARTKSGYSTSRANYMAELVCERMTGQPYETYQNAAMLRGIDLEPEALAQYCFQTDDPVDLVGFVNHPTITMAGASPDAYVGKEGLCEIKCPAAPGVHMETLMTGVIDLKYMRQMAFQMACTGRSFCDFVSWDPRWPSGMQLWIKRFYRDDTAVKVIEDEVRTFLAELCEKVVALKQRYGEAA